MIPLPVNLTLLIIFSLWLSHIIDKNTKYENKIMEDYLKREQEAALTEKSDISHLPKINLPTDFPFVKTSDNTLISIMNELRLLSQEDIINLNHLSNTDIRLQYGTAHFDYLSKCDTNYTKLCMLLNRLEKYYSKYNFSTERKLVLEYAVSINSDTISIYQDLANIYTYEKNLSKIQDLINSAQNIKTTRKYNILNILENI